MSEPNEFLYSTEERFLFLGVAVGMCLFVIMTCDKIKKLRIERARLLNYINDMNMKNAYELQ